MRGDSTRKSASRTKPILMITLSVVGNCVKLPAALCDDATPASVTMVVNRGEVAAGYRSQVEERD
jgi:hypothetical protein